MKSWKSSIALAILLALASSASNSQEGSPTQTHEDQILVTQAAVPAGVAHTVLGPVEVRAGGGMSRAVSLWPQLAVQAKAKGGNAVVQTQGGHRVTFFSWAAPYANGIAVKFEEPEKRKELTGLWY